MLLLFNPLAYRELRKEKRITQKALADHKVSGERYISALENGERHRRKCECRYARLQLACVLRILVFAPYDQD